MLGLVVPELASTTLAAFKDQDVVTVLCVERSFVYPVGVPGNVTPLTPSRATTRLPATVVVIPDIESVVVELLCASRTAPTPDVF
jgi:hypothetical protein